MLEENYQPHRGELDVCEHFATDHRSGESHLDRVSITVKLRVSHDQAVKLQHTYPGTRPNFILDRYGEYIDLEITLRIDDAAIEPYLRWRDGILGEVYRAADREDSL